MWLTLCSGLILPKRNSPSRRSALLSCQNVTPEEQKAAAEQIKEIGGAAGIADNAKAIILGVYLIRLVGADVLERSVKALGSNIEPGTGPAPNPQTLAPAAQVPGPPVSGAAPPALPPGPARRAPSAPGKP